MDAIRAQRTTKVRKTLIMFLLMSLGAKREDFLTLINCRLICWTRLSARGESKFCLDDSKYRCMLTA